jgi:hypothetical protein
MNAKRRGLVNAILAASVLPVAFDVMPADREKLTANECKALFGQLAEPSPAAKAIQKALRPEVAGDRSARLNDYIAKSNRPNQPRQVVGIEYTPESLDKTYSLVLGNAATQHFGVNDIDKLAERIYSEAESNGFLYWVPQGFPNNNQIVALERSLRVQWSKSKRSSELRSIERLAESEQGLSATDLHPGGLFGRNPRIDRIGKPEMVTEGRYKGWFKVLVELTVKVGNEFRSVILAFVIKSATAAASVSPSIYSLVERFANNDQLSTALLTVALQRELRRQNPQLKASEIEVVLQEEFGRNYLVNIPTGVRLG